MTRNRTCPSSRTLLGNIAATVVAALFTVALATTQATAATPSTTITTGVTGVSTQPRLATKATPTSKSAKPSNKTSAKKTPFRAPTKFVGFKVTCKQTAPETWKVTIVFKVTGGRYANLGSGNDKPTYGDNVYKGDRRYIASSENWHGDRPTAPGETTTADFSFQQRIAPIGRDRNSSNWRYIVRTPRVTFTCR